ncbi:MAG: acetyltransferase-like isoleucine patch superfamily enzyme [Psychromonas sp.]|jgi:acetyltransferase-like isoleucine patch superfamily enzyme|uniref:acyltransferase n=1 Tax=Psychromonas sp. TaxID=1884585 RepID=UPI0039E48D18
MLVYKILTKAKRFYSWPLSRKIQYVENLYFRLKTLTIYKYMFRKLGRKCVIRKPLFLTPEFISLGAGVIIWDAARIEAVHNYGEQNFNPSIILGNGVSIQQRCHITAAGELTVGDNTLISFDVMIQDTDHGYQNLEMPIGEQPLIVKKTKIGNNCFIGSGAKIQAGTILGKHCVVGTNAVVRGVFPDYCVIVGIPARIIKRYDESLKEWRRTDSAGLFLN